MVFLVLLAAEVANAAYCSGAPEPGVRESTLAIAGANLRTKRTAKNGVLQEAGPEGQRFDVLHVYGTPYDKGFAQGTLIKEEIKRFVHDTFAYLTSMVVDSMDDRFPKAVRELIVRFGMKEALSWCAKVTAPFTPQSFFDELHGIADASGVPYDTLLQLNLFAEITKASCSFMGAWGPATEGGKTFQLRALDYDTDGPFKEFPLVTIYHPEDGQQAFASVGFPASIGVLTGFSEKQIGISEIGVSFPDDSFGQGTDNTPPEKVHGIPWMFLLRDVLQQATSGSEGIKMIQDASRTCNLIIGVGDGKAAQVHGIEYSGYVATPYADVDLLPVNSSWHAPIPNVVYNAMDWQCPNFDIRMYEQLSQYASAGSISANTMIHNVLPTVQTGNLHAAVYDLTDSAVYVSFMPRGQDPAAAPVYAYAAQWTKLTMADLWAVEPDATA